jgi:hypothetical protein
MASYPEHAWCEWKFNRAPARFWKSLTNQRKFLEHLKKELKLSGAMEDWYTVPTKSVYDHGGEGLLQQYNYNLALTLSRVYPEHTWQLWRFEAAPRGYWANLDHRKSVIQFIAEKKGYHSLEDWYALTLADFTSLGGSLAAYSCLF